MAKIVGVIPARFGSERLPGKPLADILGRPMVWWVWRQVKKTKILKRVIVATDDERTFKKVEEFGAEAVMTSKKHKSGTERVAEVAKKIKGEIFLNIQGDEPLINPDTIDSVASVLFSDKSVEMVSAKVKLEDREEIENPNVVKVVVDKNDFALYFSRSPIPFERIPVKKHWKHLGIYGYRRNFLLKIAALKNTPLAKAESLEQLKVLENGFKIKVVTVESDSVGVDTEEDLKKVSRILSKQ